MLVAPRVTPWYENVRVRIFALAGFAAEFLVGADDFQRRLVRLGAGVAEDRVLIRAGASEASFAARRIAGSVVVLKNDG